MRPGTYTTEVEIEIFGVSRTIEVEIEYTYYKRLPGTETEPEEPAHIIINNIDDCVFAYRQLFAAMSDAQIAAIKAELLSVERLQGDRYGE